jgi:hypothetical protein
MNKQANLSFSFELEKESNEKIQTVEQFIKSTVVPESWKVGFPDCFEKLNKKFKNVEVFDETEIK